MSIGDVIRSIVVVLTGRQSDIDDALGQIQNSPLDSQIIAIPSEATSSKQGQRNYYCSDSGRVGKNRLLNLLAHKFLFIRITDRHDTRELRIVVAGERVKIGFKVPT